LEAEKDKQRLPEEIIQRLQDLGIKKLTRLQDNAVDLGLRGLDIFVQAETGTGKTLCFALPTLSKIGSSQTPLQGIVLVPTFSLAVQITRVFNSLQPGCAAALDRDTDVLPAAPIVVGLPWLFLQLLDSTDKAAALEALRVVVVDEADTLLMPLGRKATQQQIDHFAKHVPPAATLLQELEKVRGDKLQVMAACAIVNRAVRREFVKLMDRRLEIVRYISLLRNEGTVSLAVAKTAASQEEVSPKRKTTAAQKSQASGRYILPSGISFNIVTADADSTGKALPGKALLDVIRREGAVAPLLFIPPQVKLDKEIEFLRQSGLDAVPIEEAVVQQKEITPPASNTEAGLQRQRILVSQPRDSRGLDLHHIDLVIINYAPQNAEAFLHMAGRTARMGARGRVIILTTHKDADRNLPKLSKNLGYNIDINRIELSNKTKVTTSNQAVAQFIKDWVQED